MERRIDDSREAAAQGAQLIVWPEEALPFDSQVAHTDDLRALAAETGAYLAMGYNVMTAEGRRNEVTVLAPDGTFLGVYGKEHPTYMLVADVPVGESNALQTRLGDWVGWLALAGMAFFTVFDAITARREKKARE